MKVWITKYALTGGIITKDAETCDDTNPGMISVNGSSNETYHGND